MDQAPVFGAIDRALRNVAEAEFQRLSAGVGQDELTQRVHRALESLRKLQQGVSAEYDDPWVALLYLTWYQPGHIRLAHHLFEMMKKMRGSRILTGSHYRNVHIVDFGCGALAMKFAVAMAVADTLEEGHQIQPITVYSYDKSQAMVKVGQKLWDFCKVEWGNDPRFKTLATSVKAISGNETHIRSELDQMVQTVDHNHERWLGAFHIAYKDNVEELNAMLASLVEKTDPDVGFLTCHDNPDSVDRLRRISPFGVDAYSLREDRVTSSMDSLAAGVTQWRMGLNCRMSKTHNYLSSDVNWGLPGAFGQIFLKNE